MQCLWGEFVCGLGGERSAGGGNQNELVRPKNFDKRAKIASLLAEVTFVRQPAVGVEKTTNVKMDVPVAQAIGVQDRNSSAAKNPNVLLVVP